LSGYFGGGASPAASVSSSVNASRNQSVSAPQFHANVTVHATPGMNEQALSTHMTNALDTYFDAKMRQTAAGVE
jgi:hypothetical protein